MSADDDFNESTANTLVPPSLGGERLGVIGLGSMGAPMAEHLLRAHGSLVIHSRTRREHLIKAGARWADTPREIAQQSDALLVMLPDLPQLEEMLDGEGGLLAGERPLLIMVGSTSSSVRLRELDKHVRATTHDRVRMVDCPVSGGEDGARQGTLSIMLGGTPEDTARATAWLAPCGTPVRLGPLGAGEVAKSCNQLIVSATSLALGEVTVLAERSGLDLETLFDVLSGGYAGSNFLTSRRDKFISGDDSPSGMAKYMVKDLSFAAEIADATGAEPALLPTLRAAYNELVESGLGDRDIAVTRRFIEERGRGG